MKKLTLLIALIAAVAMASGQQYKEIKLSQDKVLLNNLDLSKVTDGDTSFVFKIMRSPINFLSIQSVWTNVIGSGYILPEVTNFDDLTNWIPYNEAWVTYFGGESSNGTDGWEDYMWAWVYLRITVYVDAETTGNLKMRININ